ncbi:MAG: twin-arginine translocase TatA/TatE family subunit [Myxococcota bacterium]
MPVPAFIGGVGLPELLLVLVLMMFLFGAGQLPKVFEALGQGVRALRTAADPEFDVDVTPESPPSTGDTTS